MTLADKVLELLILEPHGLGSPQLLAQLRPRISQPTLWRALDRLRTRGLLICEGRGRATRYHARSRTDLAALRSQRMHESVAKRLLREPDVRLQALERLAKLRAINPHGRPYHDRWDELLRGPSVELVRVMTEQSEAAEVLRKESPLSAFVSAAERQRIFASTRTS